MTERMSGSTGHHPGRTDLRWLLEPGLPARGRRLHPPTPPPRWPVPEHAAANDGEIEVFRGGPARLL